MQQNAGAASEFLKALANQRRLMILCHLHQNECSVNELVEKLDLSQSALSQHLAILRELALVATRKEGQTVFYSLASNDVEKMIALLHDLYCN